MQLPVRDKLIAGAVVFAVVFCLTARPVLNAADPERTSSLAEASLADRLFGYANEITHALRQLPSDDRGESDYRRALDAYSQVIRLNTDNHVSSESLIRRGDLLREMADAKGDSALYQQAISAYRSVVVEHPHSAFVGDALIGIAQINEESLQDLDGAAAAYKELVSYFPSSVLAREANAVLARFDAQLKNRPVDVVISPGNLERGSGQPALTNIRSFGGPDYARVVIDLSDRAGYSARRAGNRLSIQIDRTVVSSSLSGRRFIVGAGGLLKRITVTDANAKDKARVEIEVGEMSDYSTFTLSEPDRIVIDLHAGGTFERPVPVSSSVAVVRTETTARSVNSRSESQTRRETSTGEARRKSDRPRVSR